MTSWFSRGICAMLGVRTMVWKLAAGKTLGSWFLNKKCERMNNNKTEKSVQKHPEQSMFAKVLSSPDPHPVFRSDQLPSCSQLPGLACPHLVWTPSCQPLSDSSTAAALTTSSLHVSSRKKAGGAFELPRRPLSCIDRLCSVYTVSSLAWPLNSAISCPAPG